MKAYQVTLHSEASDPLIVDDLRGLSELFIDLEEEEVGNMYLVEIIEIDNEKFEELPEWGGW